MPESGYPRMQSNYPEEQSPLKSREIVCIVCNGIDLLWAVDLAPESLLGLFFIHAL